MAYIEPIAQYFMETNGVQHFEIDDKIIKESLIRQHPAFTSRFNPIALLLTQQAAEGVDEITAHQEISFWRLDEKANVLHPYEIKYRLENKALAWLSHFEAFPKYPYERYVRKGIILLDHDNKCLGFVGNNRFYIDNRT